MPGEKKSKKLAEMSLPS